MEWFFSGYCRCQDQSRTVMVELEDDELDVACGYADCAYAKDCPIGIQIAEVQP